MKTPVWVPARRSRTCPRIFQRFPGHLQQQALLGIHARRFPRRDAKEMSIELVHLLEEAAPASVHFARSLRIWIVKGVEVEAIRGNFRDGIHAVAQQLPESYRVVGAGKPAADADDGDRFGCFAVVGPGSRRRGALTPTTVRMIRQMPGESLDGGILIGQIRRKLSSQPLCEFTGEADRLRRPQAVAGEGLADVYLVRLDSEQLGKPGDQPGLDDFGRSE